MISKFGFDGSTSQSIYMQGVEEGERLEDISEESLFLTCMVPLKLVDKNNGAVYWENKRPSSTLYCRPVRFWYVKETREVILEEQSYLKDAELQPTIFEEEKIVITHEMELTMVDGKVQTVMSELTDSTQSWSGGMLQKHL